MGAGHFVKQAQRCAMVTKSLACWNRCSCHPKQWGLKKGLRRGRRRLAKIVIKDGLKDRE